METGLASDVVYSQRVAPLIQQALAVAGVQGQSTASTQFLPNLGWLEPSTVEQRLTGKSSGSAQSSQVAPGTHGSALTGVSVGSTTLEAEPTLNHIGSGANPAFTLKVENAGSNPETDVRVEVTVTAGDKQYRATRTINKTEPGVTSTVDVPGGRRPPGGGGEGPSEGRAGARRSQPRRHRTHLRRGVRGVGPIPLGSHAPDASGSVRVHVVGPWRGRVGEGLLPPTR